MDNLIQDIRYAARVLAKSPGFTIIAIITLALGVGANTAIFSVVNTVLLRPLPYNEPDRLVTVWESSKPRNLEHSQASPVTFTEWREQTHLFESIAGWWYPQINLTGGDGEPERVRTIDTTYAFFDVLRAQPLLGRTFLAGEDRPGGERIAVIGYGLWQRRFGSDPNVIGQAVTLDGGRYTIIGVMPQGFKYPEETEVWRPLGWDPARHSRNARFFEVVARLKEGVSPEQAQSEMSALAGRIAQEHPQSNSDWDVSIISLHDQIVGNYQTSLWIMLGAVGFVLLIACANVANLLLARAEAREKEVCIRLALGAGRLRLIRQFLVESALLSLAGSAVGLALAYFGGNLLMQYNPVKVPNLNDVTINGRVLLFTLGVAMITGLVFGLVPALHASRTDLNRTLKEGGRDSKASSGGRRIRSTLVVAEIAIALVLLVGAGLMLRSFFRLQEIDTGFNSESVLTFNLQLPFASYQDWRKVPEFYTQLLDRIEALPGVKSADATGFLPLQSGWRMNFNVVGRQPSAADEELRVQYHQVSPGYFQTLGIPLISGREFQREEDATRPGVAIISQALARSLFPDEDPIGKRVSNISRGIGPLARYLPQVNEAEIIGIVGDVKNNGIKSATEMAIYFPQSQFAYRSMNVVVRTQSNPMSIVGAVRNAVWSLDSNMPISNMKTMEQTLSDSIAPQRFTLTLLGLFAALSLALAGVGIYGVMSYTTAQRTREVGVRMALGASRSDITSLVMKQVVTLAATGVAIGLAGAFGLTRLMATLIFGVSATDPLAFTAVSMLLAGVALLAGYIPAYRATKVDPMTALRYE
jgi:putative ABC transport system permease protein